MKQKKQYLLTMIFILAVFLIACGKKANDADEIESDQGNSKVETNTSQNVELGEAYIVVPIPEYHDKIWDDVVYGNDLYYICYEESTTSPTGQQAVLVRINFGHADISTPPIPEIMPLDIPAEQLAVQLAIDGEGNPHVLTIQYVEFNSSSLWGEFVDMFWHHLSSDGKIIETVAVAKAIREYEVQLYLPRGFEIDSDGNAHIAMWTSLNDYGNEIFVINPAGELIFHTPIKNTIWYLLHDTEGNVYAHHYPTTSNVEGSTTSVISLIDLSSGSLNDIDITAFADNGGFYGMQFQGRKSLFLADREGVFDLDLEGGTKAERFTWASLNVMQGMHEYWTYQLANGQVLLGSNTSGSNGVGEVWSRSYRIIRHKSAEDIAAAEEMAKEWEVLLTGGKVGDITLGVVGMTIDPAISKAIEDFNTENPYSRILVKQYGVLYGDDQSEGLFQLNNDIISGKCPDILLLHQDISYGAYVVQGVFRDLNPFLEADDTFDMADYRENIIRAYEIGDGLYGIPVSFGVLTLYGKAADTSGIEKWNMDEFIAFADRFPESRIFRFPTKTDVLNICLKANGGNLVNWASKDPEFNRDMLIKILEFSNRFVDAEKYEIESMVTDRASEGDIRLMEGGAILSRQVEMEIFGGPVNHIGYPSETGNGYIIYTDKVVAISSKCQYIDTAWQFISILLSDEVQSSDNLYGLPVKRSSIERRATAAKNYSGWGGVGDQHGDLYVSYEIRGATDEEINLFLDLLEQANEIRVFDRQIDDIIKEEAGHYFNGDKSVGAVADVIENRVGIYVKEIK